MRATPADLETWQDSISVPVAQSPAADWQFRQQLLFADEASLPCRCLVLFGADLPKETTLPILEF